MSEKDQAIANDVQENVQPENNSENKNDDSGKAWEVARKASGEAKNERQKRVELEKRLTQLQEQIEQTESAKLEEQGKYKELYAKANERANQAEKRAAEVKAKFAANAVSNTFVAEAAKSGASRPEDLLKLVTADKLIDKLEVDDDFNINPASLKNVIEESKSAYSYLFGKPAPDIKDSEPAKVTKEEPKSLENMTYEEKIASLARFN